VPEERPGSDWAFVTNHFVVLLCVAEQPDARLVDIAARAGLTERTVLTILGDLVSSGYVERMRIGRRNHYRVDRDMPLRHLATRHRQLGDLLGLLERPRPALEG
jgi:DNA-binding IclR family transcriptional regulator